MKARKAQHTMTASALSRRSFLAPAVLLPLAAATGRDAAARPGSRVLVAYFSRSGNTRVIAGQIKRALDAALFEIEAARAYPEDYLETVEQARRERDAGTRPPLKSTVAGIAAYDTVYLGFPIWGETAPPLIRSFLAAHDLAGKTVIPFITHGGYGLGDSLAVLARHAPAARLRAAAFVLQADQERQTMEKVAQWLRVGNGRG